MAWVRVSLEGEVETLKDMTEKKTIIIKLIEGRSKDTSQSALGVTIQRFQSVH